MPETDLITPTETTPEDDYLLEDDGDPFWMIQKMIWITVKTVLLLGIMALVIWLIWGNSWFKLPAVNLSLPNTEKPISLPTKTQKKNKIIETINDGQPEFINQSQPLQIKNPALLSNLSWSAAKWNYWLRLQTPTEDSPTDFPTYNQALSPSQTIVQAVTWLRDSEKFFAVKPLNWVNANTPNRRQQQLDRMIRTIDYLLSRSTQIKAQLRVEIAEYRQKISAEGSRISTADTKIRQEIERLQGTELETFMRQKITAENQKFSAETQSWLRTALIQKIEAYETPLRNLKNNAQTNRQAIIHNIKVTDFPDDPFQRVNGR